KLPVLQRNRKLVQPIYTTYAAADGGKTSTVSLEPYDITSLRYVATKHAAYFKRQDKKGNLIDCEPHNTAIDMLLKKKHWGFSIVEGIINTPTLRKDGSIFAEEGLDPETGIWLQPEQRFYLDVPSRPSKRDGEKALELYKDLVNECAFSSEL